MKETAVDKSDENAENENRLILQKQGISVMSLIINLQEIGHNI
jgi:hypothetical protein